jgi:methionyl-tRNA formyltransferase
VVETVNRIANNTVVAIPQRTSGEPLRDAPKIFKETCTIDWNRPAHQVHNHIRGLSPYPAAQTVFFKNDKEYPVKVFRSALLGSDFTNAFVGSSQSDGKSFLLIRCSDSWISLLELQLAGKKRMPISEFLKGFDATEMQA